MIIGLVGFKGSGKTTIANTALMLNDGLQQFQRIGFADPIVAMLEALGVSAEALADKASWETPLELLGGKTIRHAAQTLGTEWGRALIQPDLWVNVALRRAANFPGCTIIDNVRFPNEADKMDVIIRMTREGFKEPADKHPSESYIPFIEANYEFINEGNITKSADRFYDLIMRIKRDFHSGIA